MSVDIPSGTILPVWRCAARPQPGRREKAALHSDITGRLGCHILSAMCATKHNVTERNGSVAEGTPRASSNPFFSRGLGGPGAELKWSGVQ